MDFRLFPDDRIGGPSGRKGKSSGKSRTAAKSSSRQARARSGSGSGPKSTSGRTRKASKPWTFWGVIGRLAYWGLVLGVWTGIALAGVASMSANALLVLVWARVRFGGPDLFAVASSAARAALIRLEIAASETIRPRQTPAIRSS